MGDGTHILVGEDIGQVKIGDTVLPGVYQQMSVRRPLRMPESTVSGRSGSSKQPTGWEDAEVQLEIRLVADEDSTVKEQAETIAGLHLAADVQGRPYLYTISHWLLRAMGVRQVVFVELELSDDNQTDTAFARLNFKEHRPPTRKVEARSPRPGSATSPAEAVAVGDGQTAADWLSQGVTIDATLVRQEDAAFADGVRQFFNLQVEDRSQSLASRPSVDEDVPHE